PAVLVEQSSDSWDAGDFLERLIACNRWTGRFGDPLGEGPLLEIPVNCESYNLAFVPRILDKAECEVVRLAVDGDLEQRALQPRIRTADPRQGRRGRMR